MFEKWDWVTVIKYNRSYIGKIKAIDDLMIAVKTLRGKIIFAHTDDTMIGIYNIY